MAAQNWVVPDTGTASIRGTITAANGSGPAVRAEVHLSGRMSQVVLTDAAGRYVFRDLPRGRYSLTAGGSGYLTTGLGAREPGDRPRRFELRDGESRSAVDLALPRGGVIEVFATDEQGEPLEGVWVTATRYLSLEGRLLAVPSIASHLQQRNIETDDRGLVRLADLPPGDYILTARVLRPRPAAADGREIASGIRRRYLYPPYPGPASASGTRPLALALGQELQVRMSMTSVAVGRVAGRVVHPDGSAMTRGGASLTAVEPAGVSYGPSAALASDGTFSFADVPAGRYVIEVGPSILDRGGRERATVAVVVPEAGLTDLVITTHDATRLRGRIVIERDSNPRGFDPQRFSLMAHVSNRRYVMAELSADRQVTIDGLGGTAVEWVWHDKHNRSPQPWFLKAVRLNGLDVTHRELRLPDGEDVSGLEVVVTQHAARLSGTARDEHGEAVTAYQVVVFAADPARWTPDSRSVAVAAADELGRFEVRGLPAGRYLAVALENDSPKSEVTDPAFLLGVRSAAMEITLGERDSRVVTLPFTSR